MKSLWWTRFVFGQHLKEGVSVWDKVVDATIVLPKETFEERFAKANAVKRKSTLSDLSAKKREFGEFEGASYNHGHKPHRG
jgi:hypothetical protein